MTIAKHQLTEIESLLSHSMNGIHVLFDNATVAKILQQPTETLDFFKFEKIEHIQRLFTQLVEKPNLAEKRNFLHSLTQENFEILVRTYFHIVDNSLLASNPKRH